MVAGLSLGSAVAAVALSALVFPHLSINNDEPIYRLHADAIAHGHIFIPAPEGLSDSFRPWLAAVDGGHYVLKYNPAVPALIALSQLVTGGTGLFLAGSAAAAVAMTYVLGREVLRHEWDAVIAAGFVALSPLVVVQSALLLPYVTTFVLLEVFCWGLVRAHNTARTNVLVISGLAIGAAFVIRPYDAVLFAPPLLVWVVWSRPGWSWARAIPRFVVPGGIVASGFFIYNAVATGSPLQPSFSLLEPQDALGFGLRRLYPSDLPHHFGLSEGIEGVVRHGRLLNQWLIGGVVLFALAAVALLRRRVGDLGPWLAAPAVLLPLGYVFFWGPWNASVLWGGTRYVGPFYFLPVLIPVAILAARTLGDFARLRRSVALLVALAMVALTGPAAVRIISDNTGFKRQNQALVDLVDHGAHDKVILTELPTPYLMHPSPVVGNNWDLSNSDLFAVAAPERDIDVVAAFPGRTPYRLTFEDDFIRPDARLHGRLEELRVTTADRVDIGVLLRSSPGRGRLQLAVTAAGMRRTYEVEPSPSPGQVKPERLIVDPNGASLSGRTPVSEVADPAQGLRLQLLQAPDLNAGPVEIAQRRLPLLAGTDSVTMLVPAGRFWTAGAPPTPVIEVTS